MQKRLLALLAAAALVVVLAVFALIFWPVRGPTPRLKSVIIRYAGQGSNAGAAPGELAFWVTNHTSKKLCILPLEIEVQAASGWKTYSQVSPFRWLCFSTNAGSMDVLGPGEAGYGSIPAKNLALPTNAVWRLKASVGERLEGIDRLKLIPGIPAGLRYQRSAGKKVDFRVVNPFCTGVVVTEHLENVLSEEVVPQ